MEEVLKTSNNNSSTSPQIASLQGTTLQEAQLSHVSQQVKTANYEQTLEGVLSRLLQSFPF